MVLALGVLVAVLGYVTPSFAAITLADTPRFIGEELEEWEDTSGSAAAADALARGDFRRPSRVRPNHGFTRSAFFYRFSVKNGTTDRRAYVLDAARAWVSDVDLYRVDAGIAKLEARAGALTPLEKRVVRSEAPAFALELDAGEEQTFLLRMAGPAPIALRGEISPRAVFNQSYAHGLLLWGGLYGVILGIAVYLTIIVVVLRDAQWWLAPGLFAMALLEAANRGHLARFLPIVIPYVEVRVGSIAAGVVVVALSEWARVVLRSRLAPRVDRVIRVGEVIGGSLCLVGALVLRWTAAAFVGPILATVTFGSAAVLRWRDGHAAARPFAIVFVMVIVPASTACATALGYVPLHPLTEHGDYLGGMTMAVLLALGVSQEMRVTRSDLERKNREVSALADDLREQVVQRSRELARVLDLQGRSSVGQPLETGILFDERYRVVRLLGEGGMGAVYEVVRTRDDRRFALKVLTSATNSAAALRLTREAEIGARLRHPNLVSIVDVGFRDGRVPFLVMDLVLGGSLEDHSARFGDAAWALDVLRGVAAGLRELHGASVIHRDLKPANVLMEAGVARICDFGIAKPSGDDVPSPRSALTSTGAVVGTALYMAPETMARAPLTPAADIFAFGLIAFELLTGEFPLAVFCAAALGPRAALPAPDLARVAGLAAPVRAMLEACIAMDPTTRPTASELDELLSGASLASPAA